MSLGKNPADVDGDLRVVRRAMEARVWFHASPTYNNGFTYMVLRRAFDEDRTRVPQMVIKVRDASVSLMRFEVEDSCRRLGLEALDVAQLVSMDPEPGNLVDQLRAGGGALVDELAALRERGLIRKAVIFLQRNNSEAAVEAILGSELVDGAILYWNACQRECTDAAWSTIREREIPTLALRTLGGGPNDPASQRKADHLSRLIETAGCQNATEFNLRLAASEPRILTTIGGTASMAHLEDFLDCAASAEPLPEPVLQEARKLQTATPTSAS